jgi:hypothetical protein
MTVADVAGTGRNQVPRGIAYTVGSTVMFAGIHRWSALIGGSSPIPAPAR